MENTAMRRAKSRLCHQQSILAVMQRLESFLEEEANEHQFLPLVMV